MQCEIDLVGKGSKSIDHDEYFKILVQRKLFRENNDAFLHANAEI